MKRKFLLDDIPLFQLGTRVLRCGKISPKGIIVLIAYYLKLCLTLPAAGLQSLMYARRIRNTTVSEPPIFILGHYRSGTTFLHKLLTSDQRFGFLTNYDMACPNTGLLFGKWLQRILQFIINSFKFRTSFFNDKVPELEEPAEEDRYLVQRGSAFTDYWGFIFPLSRNKYSSCTQQLTNKEFFARWRKEYLNTLKFITYKNKGRQLVLKNPPNTERIPYLLEMFPGAKFIYIYRNPFHLFYSMQNMWMKAIRKYCLQKITDVQIEEIIFQYFENMLEQYEKDKGLIPPSNLIEVQYEEMEAKPLEVMQHIYTVLDIPGFESVRKHLLAQLQKERQYRKFQYDYDETTFDRVEQRWGKYIKRGAYGVA